MKTEQNEIYSPYQCLVVLNNHRSEVVHNLPATTNMCIMSNLLQFLSSISSLLDFVILNTMLERHVSDTSEETK